MLSGFAPRTAAGDGIPAAAAGTSWRARLPVALVILTLVALLAVPIVVSRRGAVIRAEVVEVTDPARLLVNQLELAAARAAAAIRGYLIDGHRAHLEQYRAAREQEARVLAALRPLVERVDPAAASQLTRLEALLVQWHMRQDRLAAGRMTPPEYTAVLSAQDELYQEVLYATEQLRSTIVAQVNERRRGSAAIQRLGVVMTSILVVMAFVSILFVLRLGRRLERRGQELAASEARERFLSEAARVLVGSIDYEETLRATADLAVPAFADICLIDVVQDDGSIRRIVSTHPDPAIDRRVRRLEVHAPRPGSRHPIFEAMRTGRSAVLVNAEATEASAQSAEHLAILREIAPRFILLVPLIARGRALGAIQFMATRPDRDYAPEDVALAEDLAGRAALAIDNARLYRAAHDARAEAEQRAQEEAALREAAAAVSAASTVEETAHRIAESALSATHADGAYFEHVTPAGDEVEVVATAGVRVPSSGATVPYAESLTREVIESGEPRLIPRLGDVAHPLPEELASDCADCSAAVIPMTRTGQPVGALFLLRLPGRRAFGPDEIARAFTFGDLASVAFHRIQMLEESERRRQELLRLTESRSRLMRGFGHDVKNPLGAADGQLQLIEEGIVDEVSAEVREGISRARRSIRAALGLIEDLLALARWEAGQVEVEQAPTDVRDAARTIVEEYRAQAEGKGLTLHTELPDELPIIESDPARIRQVLSNLLSNAVKYTETGWIAVRVEEREGGAAPGPGRWIAVDVADTGPGIPEEKQELMFKEFTRLEPGARRGAGVGLAMSRRIARALNGDVTVDSAPGRGSTFTLWLPLAEPRERRRKAA